MKFPAEWIVPDWPAPPGTKALITTRASPADPGGASPSRYAGFNLGARVGDDPAAVARNLAALRRFLPAEPCWMTQVHGTRVRQADAPGQAAEADGATTRVRGTVCAVLSADCLPVLLAEAHGTAVGIAHAGWRGLAAGVIENVVLAMCVPPADLIAYLGPAIGPRAYEVGADVFDAFVSRDRQAERAFEPLGEGKYLADLGLLARQRLEGLGVKSVCGGTMCTYSDGARFYSFRRDGATGRMASLVWME